MSETVNQVQTAQEPEKTFTQAELNAIIDDRLRRERAKYEGFDDFKAKAEKYDEAQEAAKTDLQKAQEAAAGYKSQLDALQKEINTRNVREKVASEKGVPIGLLTGDTEEECNKQAENLLTWRGDQKKYPTVPDGGSPNKNTGNGTTRDQFADWFSQNI